MKIAGPKGFHSKLPLGACTHPFPSWMCSSTALSTCLFIYMVAQFFSDLLSYRAIPIKITPELSINTLAQNFQAVNKPVKLVTCWCPAPLLLKYRDLRALSLLRGPIPAMPFLPASVPTVGPPASSVGWPPGVHIAIEMQGRLFEPAIAPPTQKNREIISGLKPHSSSFITGAPELDLVLCAGDTGGAAVPW